MVFVAIGNGLFREKFLLGRFNELQAHQLSTVSMIGLLGVYVWFLFKLWLPVSGSQALFIGLLWFCLTVLFEFAFGHYVAGHSWSKLLHDYNILEGRVWIIALLWITLAPYITYQLQK